MRYCLWVFGCCVVSLSCVADPSRDEVTDAGDDIFRAVVSPDRCGDPRHRVATGVALLGMPVDRRLAVAKNDPTDEDDYRVTAVAFHDDGEDVTEVDKTFQWEMIPPDFISYVIFDTNGRRSWVSLRVREDIFDRNDDTEPSGTFRVCVQNTCCPPEACESEICSAPVTVESVVSLEGRWQIAGLGPPLDGATVTVRQNGRTLLTILDEFRPVIRGSTVIFYIGDDRYEGTIHPERNRVEGTVVRTNDQGDDVLFGQWAAQKIDPRRMP